MTCIVGFLWVLRFPPLIKLSDHHDIIEILLKVALNTINQPLQIDSLDFLSVMVFELSLIAVRLLQDDALVDLLYLA
jgi:hypothetical protein